ncbi:YeeE/YedE thiosulfate transporter family protein [Desulfocurvibacter africanus]|uniref:Uncharacterized protein n=1 Tax=Desulfocurvibacter africanus subsp. africanus str. Walvis Bay TaxID=690850 RepID=F3YYP4_DESAF|nr:YeeE/YedE thiosulfate transporter family protein [Desulfocurvibacter africanus]EGJ51870.1 protein of unknown function DUF395 YeeE/YedE [Desulfocurvibacter africanus subsp. africanus str. Walvis Bay]
MRQSRVYWACLLAAVVLVGQAWAAGIDPAGEPMHRSIWTVRLWSPYIVGLLIGLLNCLALVISDRTLGASSAYATAAGMVEKTVPGGKPEAREYYRRNPPRVGWGFMLLLGVVVGSFLSAQLSTDFRPEWVPPLWLAAHGPELLPRLLTAFAGGAIMAFGARVAGGCTSGHGISGTMQLATSSWLALACFFIGGAAVAHMLY